ncbi:MAG: alpha/beta hydrolase, partial [Promicromonosporaceae bacterium]|nr:alpha/beta hydrolase [Promicromonosporaceae bacterium]
MSSFTVMETESPSLPLKLVAQWIGHFGRLAGKDAETAFKRYSWARLLGGPPPPTLRVRQDYEPQWRKFGGLPVLTMNPRAYPPARDLVYIHGGGYSLPMLNEHWWLIASLANTLQARTHLIRYRVAPWAKAPQTVPEVIGAYRELVDHLHYSGELNTEYANPVVLAGDSAGGGLAIVVTEQMIKAGQRPPDHVVLFSPWVDLENSNPQFDDFAEDDPYLSRENCEYVAERYRGDWALSDPRVSPLYADPRGMPPMTLTVGTNEAFFPQICDFAEMTASYGIDTAMFVAVGGFHVFPILPRL